MKDEIVRFTIALEKDAYEALVRLRNLTGKKTLSETIIAALKVYRELEKTK